MAVKVIVPNSGDKLLPGHEASNAFDFPFVSGTVFPVPNVKEYYGLLAYPGAYMATHPRAVFLAAQVTKSSMVDTPLAGRYWSMGAFKLGDKAVKYKTYPCGKPFTPDVGTSKNMMRDAMKQQLITVKKPACFIFAVQFQGDPETMPVENPSVEWSESEAPFEPIARIDIPAQTFTNPDIKDLEKREGKSSPQDDFCERLSFNPWRTTYEQHPLGNLMRARRAVYARSLAKRLDLNKSNMIDDNLTGTEKDVLPFGAAPSQGR